MAAFTAPKLCLFPAPHPRSLRGAPATIPQSRCFAGCSTRAPRRLCTTSASRDESDQELQFAPTTEEAERQRAIDEDAAFSRIIEYVFPDETDWKKFWENDDYSDWYDKWAEALHREGGFDVTDPKWKPTEEQQMEWLYKAVPRLIKKRKNFTQFLPSNWQKHLMEEYLEPDTQRPERNPELSVWDLRAMMEKRRAREKMQKEWHRRMDEVGKFRYYETVKTDKRLTEEDRAQYSSWSEEDIWNLITQNGEAADPRDMAEAFIEEDPLAPANYPQPYIEETEDWLRKRGRLIEPDSDLDVNQEITLLSSDFKDFEQAVGEME